MAAGKNSTILIVDDDPSFYDILKQELSQYNFVECNNIKDSFQAIHSKKINAIIWDLALSEDHDYDQGLRDLPKLIKITKGEIPVIVATWDDRLLAYGNALDNGADCFLRKSDYNIEKWKGLIEKAIYLFQVNTSKPNFKNAIDFVAVSPSQLSVKEKILQLATDPSSPILVEGEAGVGKNTLINYLLQTKYHTGYPIKKISAETVSNHNFNLLFLGDSINDGLLRQTENGVLIIEKIESLDHASQLKLHNLLCKKEYQPLDTDYTLPIKSHFIFTIENELEILEGNFLKELYNQLSKIHLLPLRNCTEDIKPLINYFLGKKEVCPYISIFFGKHVNDVFEKEVLDILVRYRWYGNVRELRYVCQRLINEAEQLNKRIIDKDCLLRIERLESPPLHLKEIPNNKLSLWSIKKQKAYDILQLAQKAIINSYGDREGAEAILIQAGLIQTKLDILIKKVYNEYPELINSSEFESIRRFYVKIFICAAPENEDMFQNFKKHILTLKFNKLFLLDISDNFEFEAGNSIGIIKRHMKYSDIFIILLCKDFLAPKENNIELKYILNNIEKIENKIIPIITRYCNWEVHPNLALLSVLPKDKVPIFSQKDKDEALLEIINEIGFLIERSFE